MDLECRVGLLSKSLITSKHFDSCEMLHGAQMSHHPLNWKGRADLKISNAIGRELFYFVSVIGPLSINVQTSVFGAATGNKGP